jgi:hypothetical protein
MTGARPVSVGLSLGLFFGAIHAIWAILVWVGAAQPLMDFIFDLHMIKPPYVIEPFNILRAVALVLVTGASGFISGWFFGLLWKRVVARAGNVD